MLAMVNGSSEQENSFPQAAAAAPVHEKYAPLPTQHDAAASFLRPDRGPLTTATNTVGSHRAPQAEVPSGGGGAESDEAVTKAAARSKEKRSTKSKCPPGLRSGKWTPEEEAFTNMLIHYFKRGLLHLEDGTSLRWYLAKRLNCEAMRVTKKLKGNSSIGKQIFRALESSDENQRAIRRAAEDLAVVENLFLDSLAVSAAAPPPSDHLVASYLPRVKKSPPATRNGAALLKHHPSLEATKHATSRPRAASEDAKLLLHFFEGVVHETTAEGEGDEGVASTPGIEKKRLFSEVECSQNSTSSSPSPSSSSSSRSSRSTRSNTRASDDGEDDDDETQSVAPPASKRQSVKIENLMS